MNSKQLLVGTCGLGLLWVGSCRDYDTSSGSTPGEGGAGGDETSDAGTAGSKAGSSDGSMLQGGAGAHDGRMPGGEAGHFAGFGPSAGGAGGASGSGTSPEAGAGGAGDDEEIHLSKCLNTDLGHPVVPATPAADVAASLSSISVPYAVFATQPMTDLVILTWKVNYPADASFLQWACFDRVVSPRRIAASNLSNSYIQAYVTTASGALFMRQSSALGYEPWTPLSIPPDTKVLDVDVVDPPTERPALYVATDKGVYVRSRTTDFPYAPFGPWQRVAEGPASVIAVGILPGGRHDLVVMNDAGGTLEFIETQEAATFDYAAGKAWDEPTRDATFAVDVAGAFKTFALTESGSILERTLVAGSWGEWTELKAADFEPDLVTLTAGSYGGQEPFLFGVDLNGVVNMSRNAGLDWIALP